VPFPGSSFPPAVSPSKAQCSRDLILVFVLPLLQIPKIAKLTGYITQITTGTKKVYDENASGYNSKLKRSPCIDTPPLKKIKVSLI
jgi:hypothetical protein